MRQTRKCPKCDHHRILDISLVPGSTTRGAKVAEIPYATAPNVTPGNFGQLEAAVCRACGFTEFYVKKPDRIPIDGTFVKEIVGPEPQVYR